MGGAEEKPDERARQTEAKKEDSRPQKKKNAGSDQAAV